MPSTVPISYDTCRPSHLQQLRNKLLVFFFFIIFVGEWSSSLVPVQLCPG